MWVYKCTSLPTRTSHDFHTTATRLPHVFHSTSTRLPHVFHTSSTRLPHDFHTTSTRLPHAMIYRYSVQIGMASDMYYCMYIICIRHWTIRYCGIRHLNIRYYIIQCTSLYNTMYAIVACAIEAYVIETYITYIPIPTTLIQPTHYLLLDVHVMYMYAEVWVYKCTPRTRRTCRLSNYCVMLSCFHSFRD